MANHVRQQIRERVGTVLTGLTTTGSNVYQSLSETSEPDTMGVQQGVERLLTLAVEGYAKATANLDDTLDTICKEVETAIAGDTKLNNLARNAFLTSTEIQLNGDGEQPIGVATMTFEVNYRTINNAPDVAA